MGVLNELISAVRSIFLSSVGETVGMMDAVAYVGQVYQVFAWEDRWVDCVMDAREVELKWMVKGMIFLRFPLVQR